VATDSERVAPKHSWVWLVVLVGSGAIGIYLAAPATDVLDAAWSRLADVPAAAISIVVVGALGLVATEALRIAVIGRIAGARVRVRDAWDAAVANHVMTAVTPQVGLGEPTVAYTLAKRGVPWDAAVAIPFVKFTTSLALVFVLGAVLVATGFGPPVEPWMTRAAIMWFGATAVIAIFVIAVCSSARIATRWIPRLAGWLRRRRKSEKWDGVTRAEKVALRTVTRLATVRRISKTEALLLLGVHLVYYASYIAPLVGLACVLGDPPFVTLCLRALVYLCFVFAIPTPGGVGPSEAAAAWFFGDLVAPADAIVVVVVFRASTCYLQLAIGVLYLPIRSLAGSPR